MCPSPDTRTTAPPPDPIAAGLHRHRELFLERFGEHRGDDVRLFFAPGRVNLMGAHLDYNGGPVMPMAIDSGTFIAAAPRGDRRLRLSSLLQPGDLETELDALPRRRQGYWFDYPLGVASALSGGAARSPAAGALPPVRDGAGRPGLDVLFGGNLAIGAGLSSSASICVGTAFALDALWGLELDRRQRVELALWAEREFVDVHCGIMDPFAVGLSRADHLLWLDCKDASHEHLPLDTDQLCIAVADTGVRRELAQSAFNERVEECRRVYELLAPQVPGATCLRDIPLEVFERSEGELSAVLARRGRHVLEEVRRTLLAREALGAGDAPGFGEQMIAAHRSLRDLFEVSVPELDCLVDAALGCEGVLGTRLTGAGFGGCTVVLLRLDARERLAEELEATYGRRFGRAPSVGFFHGDAGPREL